jgi:hypothetical protein
MGVRRLTAGASAAPLLLAALIACGGHHSSVADPPVDPSPSTSPTDPPTRESAEHFIRRWADEDIQMQNSGDTEAFRELSIKCHDCVDLANRVDSIYTAGGYIHTKGWTIRGISILSKSGRGVLANLRVVSRPTHYREAPGSPLKSYPGGPATYQLRVIASGNSWQVKSLGQVSSWS